MKLMMNDVKAAKFIIKTSVNPKEIAWAQSIIRKYKEQVKEVEDADDNR